MSSASGPSIATSGLVLDVDMNNTQKSWLGKPTTNLITNGNFVSGAIAPWGTYNVTPTVVILSATALPYTTFNSNVMQFTSTAGTSGASLTVTGFCTVGQAYTFSFYGRILSGASASTLNFNNQNGSGDTNAWATNVTLTSSWQKFTFSFTYDVAKTTLYFYHAITGITSQFTEFQLEQSTFATPFTSTSRSTTQAIVDLTNNNTLTATSLTYASDNTFSFDGNSNYLQGTSSCGITGSVTLSAIIKPSYSGQTGPHSTIICTDVNYPYGAKLMNFKNTARYGLWLGFSGVDNYEAFIGTDINDNITKMLTASWDQSTGIVNIYLNGILQSSIATAKTIPTVLLDGKITVGTDYNSMGSAAKNKFLGNIYYASIHNRALSANEVAQNFNAIRSRYGL